MDVPGCLARALGAAVLTSALALPAGALAQNLQYLSGQNVVPAFAGWARHQDGSFTF